MWRRLAASVLLLAAAPADGARLRGAAEELLQVVAPASRAVAAAHPHVNVVLALGATRDGTPADPATFRARLNGRDVTADFRPIVAGDTLVGLRAAIAQADLRLTGAAKNRLRLVVQAARNGGGRPVRDVDRVRFGAAEAANAAPVAAVSVDSDVAAVGLPVVFDASGSHDPDLDELEFAWSFSDGTTASGPSVTHAFAAAGDGTASATVTVSDGVASAAETAMVPVALTPDPGRTPGRLRLEAAGPLELGPVALGASAVRPVIVRNVDAAPGSQVKVRAAVVDGSGFTVTPAAADLGPGASATMDVTFAPSASGHASAQIVFVASAANRAAVRLLAHGHGGAASGDGPTLAGEPIFAAGVDGVLRLAPDGARTPIRADVGTCGGPGGGGTGDVCIAHGDCRAGESCSPATVPLDGGSLCGDGRTLVVLAEDSYEDPRDDPLTPLAGTLLRFDLDAAGVVTDRRVLHRTTDETTELACDATVADAGGLAYLAEYHVVPETDACARDERDALVAVGKGDGTARTVSGLARIDAAAGVAECDFRDPVIDLAVAPDGVAKYAGFESRGLWRITPAPRWYTPDVRELFGAHPDGSVVFAVARDRGAEGTIELYRMTDEQVEHGALPLSALAPCATFAVPNNATAAAPARTGATSIVVAPASAGAVALVTFHARPTPVPATDVLPPHGDLRGTVAFSLPDRTSTCSLAGLVSLRADPLAR